jgi:hypothetical protein
VKAMAGVEVRPRVADGDKGEESAVDEGEE